MSVRRHGDHWLARISVTVGERKVRKSRLCATEALAHEAETVLKRKCLALAEGQEEGDFVDLAPATVTWQGRQVLQLRYPIVYAWMRGEEILYIGRGLKGVTRPFAHDHPHLKGLLPTDELKVWTFPTGTIARAVEVAMIAVARPPLNRMYHKPVQGD